MLAIGIVRFYQICISPLLGRNKCRFYPSCSAYAIEAFQVKGFVKGFFMAVWRILRCHPFSKGGYDPVVKENKMKEVM
ncbi:MAG: membrane protein insertion efficiency factor YidD [Deferribacteraceae bacterium]|nr:membrane protein insertion efficiency factor YidD [Deferribacteraceae bacterium]